MAKSTNRAPGFNPLLTSIPTMHAETAEALAARQRRAAPGDGQPVVGLEMMERGGCEGDTAPPQEEESTAAGDDDGRMLLEEGRQQQQQQQQSTSGRRGGGQQGAGRDGGYCKWCDMAKASRVCMRPASPSLANRSIDPSQ